MSNSLPTTDLGVGIGLRGQHQAEIQTTAPSIGFLEIISENHLFERGSQREALDRLAERYPIVLHGVSMSLGSTDPLNPDYLARLADLADRTKAAWISDHVCWTGVRGINSHDLLPLPYSEDCLRHLVSRVREASDRLGRPLVLENPSTYARMRGAVMSEEEFLVRVAEEADCGLLVDVNNVWVSAHNLGFDPEAYVDALPAERIVQIHLAGHSDKGTHLLDTHSGPPCPDVLKLFRRLIARVGTRSTLIEWDAEIPELPVLLAEAERAAKIIEEENHHATLR